VHKLYHRDKLADHGGDPRAHSEPKMHKLAQQTQFGENRKTLNNISSFNKLMTKLLIMNNVGLGCTE